MARLLNYIDVNGDIVEYSSVKLDDNKSLDLKASDRKTLEKDCSQIIKEYKRTDRFLWRGSNHVYLPHNEIHKVFPRLDRRPKDSPTSTHEFLDMYFKKHFGWKARSEGVFCTASYDNAYGYGGNNYIVFPADGYKFIWSDDISDLYEMFQNTEPLRMWEGSYGPNKIGGFWYKQGDKSGINVPRIRDIKDYVDSNISRLYDEKGIAYWMAVVVLENKDDNRYEEFWYWQPKMEFEEWLADKFESYSDKDMHYAIESKHEIMIKCKYYYVLMVNTFKADGHTVRPSDLGWE